MIHSPARVIGQFLSDSGVAVIGASDWGLFVSWMPDSPDNVVVVNDTAGVIQGRIQFTGEHHEFHGIQVRVRSKDYENGYSKMRDIVRVLEQQVRNTIVWVDGLQYILVSFTRTSGILFTGVEAGTTRRRHFSVNGLVAIRSVGTGT